jgi:predicted nuclease of predicted toxin-antitoxin system
VKLLLDENLPRRILSALSSEFEGSAHVAELGLSSSPDEDLWDYAKEHGFTILSKDADFRQMSFLRGFPPKVVWIRRGNCSVRELEDLLRASTEVIQTFVADDNASVLLLS